MWPFGRKRENERLVQLRDNVRGLAALAARPTIGLPESEDGEPPKEMRLLASGLNRTQKGDFVFDEQSAADVMAFWRENGIDLEFDYEHQALVDPPIEAPASCWWDPEIRDGELWATNMRWTDRAAARIRAKEYRYWSPALNFDRDTMRVTAVINCALTNLPATKDIAPLIAASATAKENTMDPKDKEIADLKAQLAAKTSECEGLTAKLSIFEDSDRTTCTVLGLSATAPRAERFATTNALVTLRGSLLEATGQKDVPAALGTINAWKSEAAQVATLKAQQAQMAAEAATRADAEAAADMEKAFEEGVAAGKLPKSPDHEMRTTLRTMVLAVGGGKPSKDGVAMLRADIKARSQFVTVTPTPGDTGGSKGALSPERMQIATMFGRKPADVIAFEAKRLGGPA